MTGKGIMNDIHRYVDAMMKARGRKPDKITVTPDQMSQLQKKAGKLGDELTITDKGRLFFSGIEIIVQ